MRFEEAVVMLRITVRDEAENKRLVVEGKLAGACVCELEKSWQATSSDESTAQVVVDLSSVTFVDASGKKLLARMCKSGIRLVARGIMPRCLIEEIESANSEQPINPKPGLAYRRP
jgi:anti-anti-sigma regulatory factor